MGYPINTTWTKLREKDITRLNKIIDDEYCNELEIGRKLHIMEVFEKKFNEAISDFDFETVINFMKSVDWKWSMYKDGKSWEQVPTRSIICDRIKEDCFKHGLYNIIELNKNVYGAASGGIVFEMGITGDYATVDNTYVNIYFDIAHLVNI